MDITHTLSPSPEDIDFLTKMINQETSEKGGAYPFGFFIRNEQKEIIAGCNGSVVYDTIYTDQLWVHPDHRAQGLGQQLMEKVHDYGKEVGCKMATVVTMSFQNGRGFYEQLGYACDFERGGYVEGATCVFMRTEL